MQTELLNNNSNITQNQNKSSLFPEQCLHYGVLAAQKASKVEIARRPSGVHIFWLKNIVFLTFSKKMVLSCRREGQSLQKVTNVLANFALLVSNWSFWAPGSAFPKCSQNGPKMGPKWVQNGCQNGFQN